MRRYSHVDVEADDRFAHKYLIPIRVLGVGTVVATGDEGVYCGFRGSKVLP